MQDAVINQEVENLNLNKVTAIQQKRTLAFVNHFVLTTVQFLNNFLKICERRLMEFERKIEKVEAAMVLLEARLSSIPEVNDITQEIKHVTHNEPVASAAVLSEEQETLTDTPIEEPQNKSLSVISPEYEKFMKMVHVGVPLEAAKLKAALEGLDPKILETALQK